MSVAAWVGLVAGGAVGAPARYLLDGYVQARTRGAYPWGTLVVNAIGCLALGVLTGLALDHGLSPTVKRALGSGFCGAFTTFSTFTYETVRLAEEGAGREAAWNVAANTIVGTALAGLGLAVALS
jgi:CrcB protein